MASRPGAALVTGASSGIGRELARVFARHGHDVVLAARREPLLKELAAELEDAFGVAAVPVAVDLSSPEGPGELVRQIRDAGIRIEILVNNAGVGLRGQFVDTDVDAELAMLQLNVVALTELTKRLLPDMVATGSGRILNISSTASFVPGPLMAVYYATKAYVTSFGQALAGELTGTGVTVTTVCPGVTRSEFQGRAGLDGVPMTAGPMMMAAGPVAEAAYRATMRGRRMEIPGGVNKLMMNKVSRAFMQVVPTGLTLRVVRRMHERPGH